MIDFKIVSQVDDGKKVTTVIRYYEGAVTTEDERDEITRKMVPVTRYRRTKMIGEKTVTIDKPPLKDESIREAKKEFKVFKKTPIPEQA